MAGRLRTEEVSGRFSFQPARFAPSDSEATLLTEDIDEHPIGGSQLVSAWRRTGVGAARSAARRVAPTLDRVVGSIDARTGMSSRANRWAENRVPPITEVPADNHVFVTFDDGPYPGYTDEICSLLESRGHRATFFLAGRNVAANLDLTKRVAEAGHGIGSHSFRHRQQWNNSGPVILIDYVSGHRTVSKAVGFKPQIFRPPYGHHDWRCGLFATAFGLRHYGWSTEGKDWKPGVTAAEILDEIGQPVEAGQIVLLHDAIMDNPEARDRGATVEAVGLLLDRLEASGLRSAALPGSSQ